MSLDYFAKHDADETRFVLIQPASYVTQLLISQFQSSKNLLFHMKVMKAMMKPALCMNYFSVELLLDEYSRNTNIVGSECLRIYGWLQNHKFITKFNVYLPKNLQIHETFVQASLKYSKDTRYFALAIENYIMAYDTKVISENDSFTFPVVLTNLENSHQGVHKLLLDLFKRMVCCYSEQACNDKAMINDIIELPWNNRNKYPLLAIVIANNIDLLLTHPQFRMSSFLEGMLVGLTIHHLLATSQSLVKVIHSRDVFKCQLMEMISKVLWHGDEQLVQNLIKYWISSFNGEFLEKLYNMMREDGKFTNVPTTSAKFYRLLMLRNAFKRIFNEPELDSRIKDFSCVIDGLPMKIEVFHILMDNIYVETDPHRRLENILTALKFIRFNMCIEDSSFIDQHVMRKLPDFFNLLASRKMQNIHIHTEIFGIIQTDIYQRGITLGSYESLTFSLKMLNIILKQYCGSAGSRLSKNTNIEGNLCFGKYLKDNQIWDVTSSLIFMQLIKLVEGDENSDLSELAVNLLVEYFIKKSLVDDFSVDGVNFEGWINKKVVDALNQADITSAAAAKRYFILKFELLMTKNSSTHELLCTVDLLKSRFMKLKTDSDPVKSMEEGSHLFNLMDCINYGIKRLTPSEVKVNLIPVLNVLLKIIAYHFMDFISDSEVPPSFEILDEKLMKLLKQTSWTGSSPDELKPKLLLFIWFTLRSASEISESLATISNVAMLPSEKEYLQVMTTCLDINIKILSRCCHKGAIDAGSTAIGTITKIISKEFSKLCNKSTKSGMNLHKLLVILKLEIDSGKRPSNDNGDIRSARGLIVMAHKIISNHPAFLKFLMETLLVTPPIKIFEDSTAVKFCHGIKPIQLHLLATLIKDGDLAEEMLMYYNFLLLATFKAYKESKDFVEINALLQLIGAIVPKISNQKRHIMLGEDAVMVQYEPKSVTVYEFYVKFSYAFRIGLLDLSSQDRVPLSNTYVIILLEIFSNFEYRNAPELASEHFYELEKMLDEFQTLMYHECEKIRYLAAKCYAQWIKVDNRMLQKIKNEVNAIFTSGNSAHSAIHCIRIMVQRYESSVKYVKSFNSSEFMLSIREKVKKSFEQNLREFEGANNFYIRYHLLDFLMFLGFPFDHEIVQSLMLEKGLKSQLGYKLWAEKVKELSNK